MINHWLDDAQSFFQTPNVLLLNVTNSAQTGAVGTLGTQAAQCEGEWGVKPTFLLVNFFNVGPAIEAVDAMNGVTGTGRMVLSQNLLTTGAGSMLGGCGMSKLVVMSAGIVVVALSQVVW